MKADPRDQQRVDADRQQGADQGEGERCSATGVAVVAVDEDLAIDLEKVDRREGNPQRANHPPHAGKLVLHDRFARLGCRQQHVQRLTRPLQTDQSGGLNCQHECRHDPQRPGRDVDRRKAPARVMAEHRQPHRDHDGDLQQNQEPHEIPRRSDRPFLGLPPANRIVERQLDVFVGKDDPLREAVLIGLVKERVEQLEGLEQIVGWRHKGPPPQDTSREDQTQPREHQNRDAPEHRRQHHLSRLRAVRRIEQPSNRRQATETADQDRQPGISNAVDREGGSGGIRNETDPRTKKDARRVRQILHQTKLLPDTENATKHTQRIRPTPACVNRRTENQRRTDQIRRQKRRGCRAAPRRTGQR